MTYWNRPIAKVIDIRITWKLSCDFLLVISVSVAVSYIMSEILDVGMTTQTELNDLQMSFKVIERGTNRKLVYELLYIYSRIVTFSFSEIQAV